MLAVLIAAWQPSKAFAQNEDTQFWLFGAVRGNLSDEVLITVDTSYRWREERVGADQQHIRLALEHRLAKNLTIGGGAGYFASTQKNEMRPHQQIRLMGRGFDARTRLEQRFFDDAEQVEWRLRQRVQYSFAVTGRVSAVVSGEWLKLLQGRERGQPSGTDEVRGLAGIVIPVARGLEINPTYLVIVTPRRGLPDRNSHVPQLWMNYRF
ncbi:MAG: DUF2490 domain-containing protein [Erythrobacter sp.]